MCGECRCVGQATNCSHYTIFSLILELPYTFWQSALNQQSPIAMCELFKDAIREASSRLNILTNRQQLQPIRAQDGVKGVQRGITSTNIGREHE